MDIHILKYLTIEEKVKFLCSGKWDLDMNNKSLLSRQRTIESLLDLNFDQYKLDLPLQKKLNDNSIKKYFIKIYKSIQYWYKKFGLKDSNNNLITVPKSLIISYIVIESKDIFLNSIEILKISSFDSFETLLLFEKHYSSFTNIIINLNVIGDENIQKLINIISKMISLKSLTISHMNISSLNLLNLTRVIFTLKNLTELNLSHNNFNDESIRILSNNLSKSLTSLDLSYNNIQLDAMRYLADIIPNLQLTKLNLSKNLIHKQGFSELKLVLPRFASITDLNIRK